MSVETTSKKNQTSRIDAMSQPQAPWRISQFRILPGLKVQISFKDGTTGVVDFSHVISSQQPGVFAPLADASFFAQARLEFGALAWPNGAALDPAWAYDELQKASEWAVPF